ncbi:MAG: hypothetical protein V3V62_01800 [bacterium]
MNKPTTSEARLLEHLREGMSHEEKIDAARELHREGEDLDAILKVYPEYSEFLKSEKQRQAI